MVCILIITVFLFYTDVNAQVSSFFDAIYSINSTLPKLKMMQYRIAVKDAEYRMAMADLYPKIDLQFYIQKTDYDEQGRDPVAIVNVMGEQVQVNPISPLRYQSQFDLTVTQPLFMRSKIVSNIKLKHYQLQKEKNNYTIHLSNEQLLLVQMAWDYYLAIFEEQLTRQLLSLSNQKIDLMKLKFDQGMVSNQPLLSAQMNKKNREEAVKVNRARVNQLKELFQHKLGDQNEHQLTHSNPRSIELLTQLISEYSQCVTDDEPTEVQQAMIDQAINQSKVSMSQSRFYPSVFLTSGVNYYDTSRQFSRSFNHLKYGDFYVQVAIKYNLFSGFRDVAQLEKSNAEEFISKFQIDQKKNEFNHDVALLIIQCNEALSDAKRTRNNVFLMEALVDDDQLKLVHTYGSKLDFINQQLLLLDTMMIHQQAIVRTEKLISRLAFRLGKGTDYLLGIIES